MEFMRIKLYDGWFRVVNLKGIVLMGILDWVVRFFIGWGFRFLIDLGFIIDLR